jgi:hypothetical protein
MARIVQSPIIDLQGEYMVCVTDEQPLHQGYDWKLLKGPQIGYIYKFSYRKEDDEHLKGRWKRLSTKNNVNIYSSPKKVTVMHQDFIEMQFVK